MPVLTIAERLADHDEAWVRTIITRGVRMATTCSPGGCTGAPPPDFRRDRTEGVRIALLDRGLRSDVAQTSPWLLAGAKTPLLTPFNRAAGARGSRAAEPMTSCSSPVTGSCVEGPTPRPSSCGGGTTLGDAARRVRHPARNKRRANLFARPPNGVSTPLWSPSRPRSARGRLRRWIVIERCATSAPIREVDGVERAIDSELSAAWNGFLYATTLVGAACRVEGMDRHERSGLTDCE